MPITVQSLSIYPVKSMRGQRIRSLQLEPQGPAFDRRWIVIDAKTHHFITQRQYPIMATIQVTKHLPGGIWLTADELGTLAVSVPYDTVIYDDIKIWDDYCTGYDAGDFAAKWLSQFLGKSVRLAWQPPSSVRPASSQYGQPGDQVSFADGYPLSIASTASLNALQEHMSETVNMDRFRPNIVLDGCEPFEEDVLKLIQIGNTQLELAKPAPRCIITMTDQLTGARSLIKEPIHSLKTLRRGERGMFFAQLGFARQLGTIRVGDEVTVLQRRTQPIDRISAVALGYRKP